MTSAELAAHGRPRTTAFQPISRQELIAELEELLSHAERLPPGPVAADDGGVASCLASLFAALRIR